MNEQKKEALLALVFDGKEIKATFKTKNLAPADYASLIAHLELMRDDLKTMYRQTVVTTRTNNDN